MKRILDFLNVKENREMMKHDAVRCLMLCHSLDGSDVFVHFRTKVASEHIATLCFITLYEEELDGIW